jgi:hypothetical protein
LVCGVREKEKKRKGKMSKGGEGVRLLSKKEKR